MRENENSGSGGNEQSRRESDNEVPRDNSCLLENATFGCGGDVIRKGLKAWRAYLYARVREEQVLASYGILAILGRDSAYCMVTVALFWALLH